MSVSLVYPTVLSHDDPKKAFRAAEMLLSDISFRDELRGLRAAALRLLGGFPEAETAPSIALYLRDGTCFRRMDQVRGTGFPSLLAEDDADLLRQESSSYCLGSSSRALWRVGARRDWVFVWNIPGTLEDEDIVALEATRLVINQRMIESGLSSLLQQAAAIQRSLLPDRFPPLPGFDFAARSESAESVGGDVYDFIELAPEAVGFAIADASGHGLPAALEARDVVVGLRMGAARSLKMGATIERLNKILFRSTLSSRFVSLVYGELEDSGRFHFVNAGHPAPILVNPQGLTVFSRTDRVLGVSEHFPYRTQQGEIAPGGVLILVTDGILECKSPRGEEFGTERLAQIARALSGRSAGWMVSTLFEALEEHAGGPAFTDDATALVIRREG